MEEQSSDVTSSGDESNTSFLSVLSVKKANSLRKKLRLIASSTSCSATSSTDVKADDLGSSTNDVTNDTVMTSSSPLIEDDQPPQLLEKPKETVSRPVSPTATRKSTVRVTCL